MKTMSDNSTEAQQNNNSRAELIENFKNTWAVKEWIQVGYFTEEYIYEINIHWLRFSPPSTSEIYVWGALYIVIMSVGLFGNALVIFMFVRCKTLRTSANILVINLAVSDFFMMLKMPVFVYNAFYKGPALGDFACRVYGFLGGLTGVASIMTLSAISLDRYYVIKFPLNRKYSKLRIKISLVITWMYAFAFATVPLLNIGLGKYQPEGYLISCSFDYLTDVEAERNFIFVFFVAAFVVPVLVITFSYFHIIKVVGARSWATGKKEQQDSFRHMKQEDKRRQEVKLAKVVLAVIFLWFFSWTPYAVVALLGIFDQKHLITPLSSMVPALFCKTASAIDPYVYAVSHPKFRMELKKMFRKNCRNKTQTSNKISNLKPKIWTLEKREMKKSKSRSSAESDSSYRDRELSDVEEDVVEIELKDMLSPRASKTIEETQKDRVVTKEIIVEERRSFRMYEKKLKRNASFSKLLCLDPTFSNRSSSFRRLTRKFSLNSNSSLKKSTTNQFNTE